MIKGEKMGNHIGREFIEQTKYANLGISPQKMGIPLPPVELPAEKGSQIISLPIGKNLSLKDIDLNNLIERRESLRKYSGKSLTLVEFACLLWGTQGVKSITDKQLSKRTVPSAGSRHPFETFLLVNNVEGLAPGLYRYLAISHELAKLPGREKINESLTKATLQQQHVKNSAVTFIWVAVPIRTVWRYSQRAFRYLYLDAGHVCQNLYLLAEAMNCGVCAIAAFDDNLANSAVGVDGEEQFVIYIASLGKRT
jgi:SagB-type dehydrogenase family enzyme